MKKSTNLKRVVSLLAVFTLLFSFMAVNVSAGSITEARNSVVAISNDGEGGRGSGFAIGKVGQPVQYIATNAHVVGHVDENQNITMPYTTATVVFDGASYDKMIANIVYFDTELDFAILQLPNPTDKRQAAVLCSSKYVDTDGDFAAIGYPMLPTTDWVQHSQNDVVVTRGGIKKKDRIDFRNVYMLDLAITNGNSGGPLVNEDGEVVGINTIGYTNTLTGASEDYAVIIDYLISACENEKIAFSQHIQINWILIAGGVVLLAIIVLLIILIVRKKNNKNSNNGNGSYSAANYTMPLENGANRTAPRPAPVANEPAARVIAIGGSLNGKRYSVNGAIRIGRDASKCGIAFPVNTQGVSGVHCEISFVGGVCHVKDLGSSYGTFTMDGRKLMPNAPQLLKSGDKFYLASPENTFEVRF